MDPLWPENNSSQIIDSRPPEIGTPVTPGVSHGTKIFGPKIFSFHPLMIIFYPFCGIVLQKMLKNEKKGQIYAFSALNRNLAENESCFAFFSPFRKTNSQNG